MENTSILHLDYRFAMIIQLYEEKASLLIFGASMGVGNADTGIDPGFVDIKPTAVLRKILNNKNTFCKKHAGLVGSDHPSKSSQLRKR